MIKTISALAFILPLLPMAAAGQLLPITVTAPQEEAAEAKEEQEDKPDVPIWVEELSNLTTAARSEYTASFAAAKDAYSAGRLAESESYLLTCQMINDKNPNVWNLRASVCIAQKRFAEALPLMQKVEEALPGNLINMLNYSLYYIGVGQYEQCLKMTDALIDELTAEQTLSLRKHLTYRKVLCYLMLGREEEAHKLTDSLTPLEDSPLYYYSQAAYNIAKQDREAAKRDLNSAETIFAQDGYLLSYQQSLSFSGLIERYL